MTIRSRAELILFGTTFIWGSTFVVARSLSDSISPSLYITLRFGIGTVLFSLIFLRYLRNISKEIWRRGLILGTLLGVGIVVQNFGIYRTSASKSGFITGLMVIFTPIAQMFLEGKYPKAGNVIGIIVVTSGLYLLTSPGGSSFNVGDSLVLFAAVIFGVFIVYMDIFSKDADIIQLSFIQILVTTIVAGFFVPFEQIHMDVSWNMGLQILYMAIFATVATTYSQTRFQRETTPTKAVIIYTIEPVISAVLAFYFLHEVLGLSEISGAALIVVGILVSELSDPISKKLGFGKLSANK